MTELVFPTEAPRARRGGFVRVVRVELLKLTSTRLGYGLLAVVAVLTPVWTSIAASRAGSDGALHFDVGIALHFGNAAAR